MANFSKQQSRELRRMIDRRPRCIDTQHCAENFLLKYVGFEAVARKLWHYYRCRKTSRKVSTSSIPLPELIKACANFCIGLSDDTLKLLLDSTLDRRNFKSARNIRNGIVHNWSPEDCKEASDRFSELAQHFDAFFSALEAEL